MQNYADILSRQIGPNSVQDLLIALATFAVVYVALTIIWRFLLKRIRGIAKKTKFKLDDVILDVFEGVGGLFYIAVALYASVQSLALSPFVNILIKGIFLFAIIYEVIKLSERIISFFVIRGMKARSGGATSAEEQKVSGIFSIFIKITLWSFGLLLILSNLGFNITSLVAGLGIGGLAISLALQSVLTDVFSSLSIAIDKPFKEGDFIVVGTDKGTVRHIGIKTTRLESLQGEEIVISNTELTTARVQNFRKLKKRRVVFSIGVTYGTSPDKLKKIPDIIERCIKDVDKAELDRAHFWEFGDFSLNFEIVYYIDSKEYIDYMNAQQEMNLAILEAFAKEGIEMAFPTQTVYVEKN
ncbi:MAG: mechanosensitive ion channel family protein [Kiritimatiellales bacterium]|nr:mechanosensitive ion channel family protein [Kiritimatiellales bacterium]